MYWSGGRSLCSNGDISKLVAERLTFGVEGIVGLVAGQDFSGDKLLWWPNIRCLVFGYLFLVFFGLLMSPFTFGPTPMDDFY